MLVRITEKCDMGCNHCMVDSHPQGNHMTLRTYQQALVHIMKYDLPIILISGGEPAQHPSLLYFLEIAKKLKIGVCLMSNGTFLENPKLKDTLLGMDILIQITNDDRYYPKKVPIVKNQNVDYTHRIRSLSPCDKVKENGLKPDRFSPHCFNIRSMVNSLKSYKEGIALLRRKGYFCTPSINVDGSISLGESNDCSPVGDIYDREKTLISNILKFNCNRCGLVAGLASSLKKRIGE